MGNLFDTWLNRFIQLLHKFAGGRVQCGCNWGGLSDGDLSGIDSILMSLLKIQLPLFGGKLGICWIGWPPSARICRKGQLLIFVAHSLEGTIVNKELGEAKAWRYLPYMKIREITYAIAFFRNTSSMRRLCSFHCK